MTYVRGRSTYTGETKFLLCPPKTLLYTKICQTFHEKYHNISASSVYIRSQLLDNNYYLPHAVKTLKSIQDRCSLCRRRVKKALHTAMGSVGEKRLQYNAPFSYLQSDLIGPIMVREFVNSRSNRKIWLMTNIDHFSRYISVTIVESLSKVSIMNAFNQHFHRYGRSVKIECDFGTNYSAAKDELAEEENIQFKDIEGVVQSLKSEGVQLIQRSPKAPWVQGSIERANQVIKKILPGKKLTIFQLINVLEHIVYHVNKRPIGINSTLDQLRPSDIIPIYSKLDTTLNMSGCSNVIKEATAEFQDKWKKLYSTSILRQKKWLTTNHCLQSGDYVQVNDLLSPQGYPRLARIKEIQKDSDNKDRYFVCEYRARQTFKTVLRTAQSLTLIMEKDGDKTIINDSLMALQEKDLEVPKPKKRIKIKNNDSEEIKDLMV